MSILDWEKLATHLFFGGIFNLKKVKIINLYSASSRIHASNALSSLTRAAGRLATACSLQTLASAAVSWLELPGLADALACVCRLHAVAGRPAALVNDESALEACIRDDALYKLMIFTFFYLLPWSIKMCHYYFLICLLYTSDAADE